MFVEESLWIRETLTMLPLQPGDAVLDVGSSTEAFRTREQPHIEANVLAPLRIRGLQVVCMDAKHGDGIDLVCDVADDSVNPVEAAGRRFQLVLCANLLEHTADPVRVAGRVAALVAAGGWLLVTVPRVYRYHPDPIDTQYRPAPEDLTDLFRNVEPRLAPVSEAVVVADDRRYYARRWHWWLFPLDLPSLVRYLVKPWRWKQSCVLLQYRAA